MKNKTKNQCIGAQTGMQRNTKNEKFILKITPDVTISTCRSMFAYDKRCLSNSSGLHILLLQKEKYIFLNHSQFLS